MRSASNFSGVPGRTLKEELDIECDLELEPAPRPRPEPIRRPEPAEPAIVATAPEEPSSVSPPPEPKSEFATEWNSSAEVRNTSIEALVLAPIVFTFIFDRVAEEVEDG